MLPVEGGVQLAPEQVVEGNDESFGKAEAILDRGSHGPSCRFMHDPARDRRGFDLDFGNAAPCKHPRFTAAASRHPLSARLRDRSLDFCADTLKGSINFSQTFCTVFDGQKDEIDVDGEARHLPVEKVDGCAALERKTLLLRNGGNDLDEEPNPFLVAFTGHWRPPLWEQRTPAAL
jgi:hypothetical protein